ncbi:LysR family transcriptional regulator [Caenibius sp. WL]|uniref:LysR family transcriptional regulator n=1 Tax=Caenibius sp. WL TaxID=2872646 RepID=UPI001C99EF23|nr:LysR family transcriptional regulator [Caenibius sp. WL]QZP07606.1 LysR family transcriptional regulator [Caenibius sp. WL]
MKDSDYGLFARIVEAGSLSAAARALQTSPAMASKRLSRLEQRLGVRLIHRTTRKLVLTAPGERFYEDVKRVLGAIDEAEGRLIGIRSEPSGPLRVSAPTSFGRLHIAPSLNLFLERFPLVELELDLTDENVDLYMDRVDLAVRITSDIPGNASAWRLAANHRILCASPDYIARNGAPADFTELQRHRLIAADGQWPWRLENGPLRRVVDGKSHVRTNSSEIVRELAICGVGIALRSLWDIDSALKSGALVPVLSEWQAPPDLAIYALHQKTPIPSAAVMAFIDFLKDILDPPPWDLTI